MDELDEELVHSLVPAVRKRVPALNANDACAKALNGQNNRKDVMIEKVIPKSGSRRTG